MKAPAKISCRSHWSLAASRPSSWRITNDRHYVLAVRPGFRALSHAKGIFESAGGAVAISN